MLDTAQPLHRMILKRVGYVLSVASFALHVTSLFINESASHKSVTAVVTAWNGTEIREITVHWKD
jgi:hypothetical protein